MIKSMTGYAKVRGIFDKSEYFIEIKGVNNRYLDFNFRIPNFATSLEALFKKEIRKHVKRGTINFSFNFLTGNPNQNIEINSDLLKEYIEKTNRVTKEIDIDPISDIKFFLSQPNIINFVNDEIDSEKLFNSILPKLNELLDNFNNVRITEAKDLVLDMNSRITKIENSLNQIKDRAQFDKDEKIRVLKEKIEQATNGTKVDENRLAQEVFFYAEKSDITEEIVRLFSHIKELNKLLSTESEVGKRGTFILQEMHRETNTIASKSSDFLISKNTIDIKQEIEKIREQMQNLE